jgi:hypothetical protein
MPGRNLETLAKTLHRHHIRYVLFGTMGAIAHGANLMTREMDICPALDEDNLRRIADVLIELHAKHKNVGDFETESAHHQWSPTIITVENLDHLYVTDYGELDVCPRPFGRHGKVDRFDYDRLNQNAVTITAFDIPIRVASVDDVIASKMSAQRDKDHRVFDELQRIQAGAADGGLEAFQQRLLNEN